MSTPTERRETPEQIGIALIRTLERVARFPSLRAVEWADLQAIAAIRAERKVQEDLARHLVETLKALDDLVRLVDHLNRRDLCAAKVTLQKRVLESDWAKAALAKAGRV
jgi:hypothetical protein